MHASIHSCDAQSAASSACRVAADTRMSLEGSLPGAAAMEHQPWQSCKWAGHFWGGVLFWAVWTLLSCDASRLWYRSWSSCSLGPCEVVVAAQGPSCSVQQAPPEAPAGQQWHGRPPRAAHSHQHQRLACSLRMDDPNPKQDRTHNSRLQEHTTTPHTNMHTQNHTRTPQGREKNKNKKRTSMQEPELEALEGLLYQMEVAAEAARLMLTSLGANFRVLQHLAAASSGCLTGMPALWGMPVVLAA